MKLNRSTWPYILLFLLIILLIFFAGVKYGGKVEETNKVIRYVLSITPTPIPITPTQVPTKQLTFTRYNSACGISFLYPENLNIKIIENNGRRMEIFNYNKYTQREKMLTAIDIQCDLETLTGESFYDLLTGHVEHIIGTSSANILGKKMNVLEVKDINNIRIIRFKNPNKNIPVMISIDDNLYPLLIDTIRYSTSAASIDKPENTDASPAIITP